MSEATGPEPRAAGWRFQAGVGLFVASILLPLAGVPLVAAAGLSATLTASISGALFVAAELFGVAAIAVMGKSGFAWIKSRALAFLRQHGPPAEVGRVRYRIGLAMFCLPLLLGWLEPYAVELVPGVSHPSPRVALAGDLLLVASLFVLGGNFWDKVRALFVHDAEDRFSRS